MSRRPFPSLLAATGVSTEAGADPARYGSQYEFETRQGQAFSTRSSQVNSTTNVLHNESKRSRPFFIPGARQSPNTVSAGPYGHVEVFGGGFMGPGSAMQPQGPVVITGDGRIYVAPARIPSAAVRNTEFDGRRHFEGYGTQVVAEGGGRETGYGSTWTEGGGNNPNHSPYPEMMGIGDQVMHGGQAGAQNGWARAQTRFGTTPSSGMTRNDIRPVLNIVQLYAALKPTNRPPASSRRPSDNLGSVNIAAVLQGAATTPVVREITLMVGSSGQCVYVRASRGVVTGRDVIDALAATFSDYLHGCHACAGVCRCVRMEMILDALQVSDGGMELGW